MAEASPHVERLQRAVSAVSRMLELYSRQRAHAGASFARESGPTGLGPPIEGSALDAMASWFSLTEFELATVVLAAGVEISPDMANLCALAQGDPAIPYPTTLLALAVFAGLEGASQAVFASSAPLRHWQLITTQAAQPGGRLQLHLGVPDAVLSFLIGQPVLDQELTELVRRVAPAPLLPGDVALARQLATTLASSDEDAMIHLVSPPTRRALAVAAATASALGLTPFHLPLGRLTADAERRGFARLWQRDRLALGGMLLISFEEQPAELQLTALGRLLTQESGSMVLIGAGGQAIAERAPYAVIRAPLPPSVPDEVADHVAAGLGLPATPALREAVSRFRLPISTLDSCAAIARVKADEAQSPVSIETVLPHMLPLLRDQMREAMAGLADPIEVRMSLDDLVLPDPARLVLDQIIARQRNRSRVLDEWGFRHSGGGPQGMSVLFAGPSGTGKTMAAEALAHALELDLFRVDLSRIVDKYIGETEKRLAALFDAADSTDAILLFDEADVLFGRRTEVRDSHDHYANLEVGYLLQRIETFRGIAVLTTNLPNAIDEAFSRRFAFSLHFEFPSVAERREIWRRAFPVRAPTAELDWDRLAKLSLSGGQIRVIVVNAAMLAADEGKSIGMPHVARALVSEYSKQRRRVPPAELEGWPT
ncbi:ATP-binding protein [Sphingomonas sp. DT-207]|uniref:ATP-binding protein n=1 Tax=Sphingomonas sp. DT-207 TaxID=3396167 RepID=UPI003F19318E